jgi:hypothetical protein
VVEQFDDRAVAVDREAVRSPGGVAGGGVHRAAMSLCTSGRASLELATDEQLLDIV